MQPWQHWDHRYRRPQARYLRRTATENQTKRPTDNAPADPAPAAEDGGGGSGWLQAARFSYLGLFFGVAVLIGCLFGKWLDRKFGTTPWLMMIGALLGIAAGFKELYRVATTYRTEQKKKQ